MRSKDSAEPQASSPCDAQTGAAEAPVAVLSARDVIEGAGGGSGTINDPPGSDTRPPGYADLELLA